MQFDLSADTDLKCLKSVLSPLRDVASCYSWFASNPSLLLASKYASWKDNIKEGSWILVDLPWPSYGLALFLNDAYLLFYSIELIWVFLDDPSFI